MIRIKSRDDNFQLGISITYEAIIQQRKDCLFLFHVIPRGLLFTFRNIDQILLIF